MQNKTEDQIRYEELCEKNKLLELAVEVAFQERLYALLMDKNADPDEVYRYLKMHERREAQKLKTFTAKLKEREVELKEKLAERRLELEERKQALNEKKSNTDNRGEKKEPVSSPAPAAKPPLQKVPSVSPTNSPAPVFRNGT